MKNIIFGFAVIATFLTACNNSSSLENAGSKGVADSSAVRAVSSSVSSPAVPANSIESVLTPYLNLKNALAKDDAKAAATAGSEVSLAIQKIDSASITLEQKKVLDDVKDDIRENAEHISENANKIDHQREHFIMLSKDVSDLLKSLGRGGQTLYKDFCPMANDGKGAIWISETKDISNPYLGKKMPACGTVKETLQ